MRMSEQIQDNKKIRKTREQVKEEFRSALAKTKAIFVDELCIATRDENPLWRDRTDLDNETKNKIRKSVYSDCEELGLKHDTVLQYVSDFLQYDTQTKAAIQRWKVRNAKALENLKKNSRIVSEITLPEPKLPEPKYEKIEDDDEELDAELQGMGYGEFGDTGKTLNELEGDFYEHTSGLFRMLTQKDISDDSDQDFLVEYLRPTREFRKALALELTERKRTTFYNRLHSIIELSEDFMHAIDEANRK